MNEKRIAENFSFLRRVDYSNSVYRLMPLMVICLIFSTSCTLMRESNSIKVNEDSSVISISNKQLCVSYNRNKNDFSVSNLKTGEKFIKTAKFAKQGAATVTGASVKNVSPDTVPMNQSGKAITVTYSNGNREEVMLFDNSPFAFFRKTLSNNSNKTKTLKSEKLLSFSPEINKLPASELKLSGTFGLVSPRAGKKSGSFLFMAVADPKTRNGIVSGFLTEYRGSGVVFASSDKTALNVSAKLDYGALQVKPDSSESLEMFVVGFFNDARIGLEKYADTVAAVHKIKLKPQPVVYCSWYHYYTGVSENNFDENVKSAEKLLKPYGLSVVQIDDGWQDGRKVHGTPLKDFAHNNRSFQSGMKRTAAFAKDRGFIPGIWYMPFSGDSKTPYYKDKQFLFAQKADGTPYNAKWGGDAFDLSRPETIDYVKNMAGTICRQWGYKYIKIDGLWSGTATRQMYVQTGYNDDAIGESILSDPAVTHIEAYRRGLKAVRAGAGKDVFILGCNLAQNMRTLGASIGLVDGMRVGPDNGPKYPAVLRGPNSGGRLYFLHNRIWYNDPDPLYVRKSLSIDHARLISSWVVVSGQMNSSSVRYADLPRERLKLLRMTMPSHHLNARPVDYFSSAIPAVWLLQSDKSGAERTIIGCFNWGDEKKFPISHLTDKKRFKYSFNELGLDADSSYVGYELWTGRFIGPFEKIFSEDVPEQTAGVFSLRKNSGHPMVLSTSRHITQGIIDIIKEEWGESQKTLSGESRIVGGDVYEIRIAAGVPGKSLKATGVSVSEADRKDGVKIRIISQDKWKLRVLIESSDSRNVKWSVKF